MNCKSNFLRDARLRVVTSCWLALILPWRRSRLSSLGSCNYDDDCDDHGGHELDYDDRGDGDDYSDVHDDGKISARWKVETEDGEGPTAPPAEEDDDGRF